MAMPKVELPAELEGVKGELFEIERTIRDLNSTVGDLKERKRELYEEVAAHLSEEGIGAARIDDGDLAAYFSPKIRLDTARFMEDYPPGEHPYLYVKPRVSTGAVRNILPEEIVDRYIESAPVTPTFRTTTTTTTSKEN